MESTMDLNHKAVYRTGRSRHDSKCRVTGASKTTGKSTAEIDVGHKFIVVESVSVSVGRRVYGTGTASSIWVSESVMMVVGVDSLS